MAELRGQGEAHPTTHKIFFEHPLIYSPYDQWKSPKTCPCTSRNLAQAPSLHTWKCVICLCFFLEMCQWISWYGKYFVNLEHVLSGCNLELLVSLLLHEYWILLYNWIKSPAPLWTMQFNVWYKVKYNYSETCEYCIFLHTFYIWAWICEHFFLARARLHIFTMVLWTYLNL